MNFGPELQKVNTILRVRVQKCGKTHKCKSCRSRQELSNEYAIQTSIYLQIWRRYSRERASQSLQKKSQKLEYMLEKHRPPQPASRFFSLAVRFSDEFVEIDDILTI